MNPDDACGDNRTYQMNRSNACSHNSKLQTGDACVYDSNCNCKCNQSLRYDPHTNTSSLYQTLHIPDRFETPIVFKGYGMQRIDVHPLYRTNNSVYGWYAPTVHTVPHRYFPRTNEFTNLLGQCGMYRNYSLNTVMDRTFY